jgi:hypothetical protein
MIGKQEYNRFEIDMIVFCYEQSRMEMKLVLEGLLLILIINLQNILNSKVMEIN